MYSSWLEHIMLLFQGSSVVITAGILLFSIPMLRNHFLSKHPSIRIQIAIICLFSIFAIYGTHAGKIVHLDGTLSSIGGQQLSGTEAVINFRDMVVVTSGLAAGPWTGVIVGSFAGIERYSLGGFTALPCALASILCGLFAGIMRRRSKTMLPPNKAAIIGGLTVVLQMSLILLMAKPTEGAIELVKLMGVPMLLSSIIGCYAFQQVLRGLEKMHADLEERHTEVRAQRAELRALHAQIEPHFLMNVLNSIKALIRIDQDRARHYVTLLAEFLRNTRAYAVLDLIEIKDELSQLRSYLDFQQLRFDKNLVYKEHINSQENLHRRIPPRTLLTLVENCLIHGFVRAQEEHTIDLYIKATDNDLHISIVDNGIGISPELQAQLGNQAVSSKKNEGGFGLFHLKKTLKEFYGPKASLEFHNNSQSRGMTVKMQLPLTSIPSM